MYTCKHLLGKNMDVCIWSMIPNKLLWWCECVCLCKHPHTVCYIFRSVTVNDSIVLSIPNATCNYYTLKVNCIGKLVWTVWMTCIENSLWLPVATSFTYMYILSKDQQNSKVNIYSHLTFMSKHLCCIVVLSVLVYKQTPTPWLCPSVICKKALWCNWKGVQFPYTCTLY